MKKKVKHKTKGWTDRLGDAIGNAFMYGIVAIPFGGVVYITIIGILYLRFWMMTLALATTIIYFFFVKKKSTLGYISCILSTCIAVAMPIAGISYALYTEDYTDFSDVTKNNPAIQFALAIPMVWMMAGFIISGFIVGISTFFGGWLEDKMFLILEFFTEKNIIKQISDR